MGASSNGERAHRGAAEANSAGHPAATVAGRSPRRWRSCPPSTGPGVPATSAPASACTPTRRRSGETHRQGRVSKCGDASTRACLREAASVLLIRARRFSPREAWSTRSAKRTCAGRLRSENGFGGKRTSPRASRAREAGRAATGWPYRCKWPPDRAVIARR